MTPLEEQTAALRQIGYIPQAEAIGPLGYNEGSNIPNMMKALGIRSLQLPLSGEKGCVRHFYHSTDVKAAAAMHTKANKQPIVGSHSNFGIWQQRVCKLEHRVDALEELMTQS